MVSKHGGFDCVHTTVLRDGPFGVGAVQEWITVAEDIDAISLGQSENPAIRNIAFFDVVINNTDRKFGHILPIAPN
ncbi:MAG: phosphatidylinositol kinase, partial [bacterium]